MSSYNFTDVTKNNGCRGKNTAMKRLIVGTAYNTLNTDLLQKEGYPKMGKAAMEVMNKMSTDENYRLTEEDREILYRDDFVRLHVEQVDPDRLMGIPILVEHDKTKKVGQIRRGWIDGKTVSIVAELWDADAIAAVDSGELPSLSVGYGVSCGSDSADKSYGGKPNKNITEVSLCKTPFFKGCNIMVAASKHGDRAGNGTNDFLIRCTKPRCAEGEIEGLGQRIKKKSSLNEERFIYFDGEKYLPRFFKKNMSKEQQQQDHPASSILSKDPYGGRIMEDERGEDVVLPAAKLNDYIAKTDKLKLERDVLAKKTEEMVKQTEEMAKRLKTYETEYAKRQKAEYQAVVTAFQSFDPEGAEGEETDGWGISDDTKKGLEKLFCDATSSDNPAIPTISKLAKKLLETQKINKELMSKQQQQYHQQSQAEQQEGETEEDDHQEQQQQQDEPERDVRREQRGVARQQERPPAPVPTRKPINSKSNVTDVYKSTVRQPTSKSPAQGSEKKRAYTQAFSMERTPEIPVNASRKRAKFEEDADPETDKFRECWKIMSSTRPCDIGATNVLKHIPGHADRRIKDFLKNSTDDM